MTKKLLMGNEAFAHAALEAGVSVVAGYPGTPSSELVETVARMRANGHAKGVHVEWSTNEKAALELCAGASMSGARALFTCKQVGLNVASDALMSLNYVGIKGGLVLFVADDPGPISSQTEQDTRRFAGFAKVPVFDPATPEQGYAMMKAAFELSEEYHTPVIVRPTTRIDHASTFFDVDDTTAARPLAGGGFKHDPERWVIFPKRSYEAHGEILERLGDMARIFAMDPHYTQFFPTFDRPGTAEGGAGKPYLGILCGGVSTQYALEALELLERWATRAGEELPAYRFVQMGIAYPFSARVARRFLEGLSHVLVLEELDSTLEEELIVAASTSGSVLPAHVHGRLTGEAPVRGENSTESLAYAIAHFFDQYTRMMPETGGATATAIAKAIAEEEAKAAAAEAVREARRAAKERQRQANHRAPGHVREEAQKPEARLGLIGPAAELQAQQQKQEAAVPERMAQRRTSTASPASRRQAQGAARRRQAHAARYKSPAKALAAAEAARQAEAAAAESAEQARRRRISLVKLVNQQLGPDALLQYQGELPPRPPVLCAGCPHRGAFYAIKGALDKLGVRRDDAVLCGDIGCYTLGNALPLAAVDTCLCMGAGITMAQGFQVAEPGKKQVAFVGDSTFFASGMTGIVNAVYNGHDVTFAVLDNATTAMTGSQPHPGTGVTLMGERRAPVRIDAMLEAMGVEMILHADPLNRTQSETAAMTALQHRGPSAIVFQSPCVWMKPFGIPAEVDPEVCTGCKRCITDIGCPAIAFNPDARGRKSGMRGQAVIDPDLCNGCGLCVQVCPFDAISIPNMLDYAARDQGAVRVGTGVARPVSTSAKQAAPKPAEADERPDDDGAESVGTNAAPAEDEPTPIEEDDPIAEDAAAPEAEEDAEAPEQPVDDEPQQAGLRTKEVGSVELDLTSLFGGAITLNVADEDEGSAEADDDSARDPDPADDHDAAESDTESEVDHG